MSSEGQSSAKMYLRSVFNRKMTLIYFHRCRSICNNTNSVLSKPSTFHFQNMNTSGFRACVKELYETRYDPVSVGYAVLTGQYVSPNKCFEQKTWEVTYNENIGFRSHETSLM